MVERLLKSLGYMVVACSSSRKALDVYTAHPNDFDMLVTDMAMPEMDGIVLAEKLLLISNDLPVILCTGFGESVEDIKAKSVAIRACVRKPIIQNVLAQAIRKVFDEG